MVLQMKIARQKKRFPFEIYQRTYSIGDYVKYRPKISVCIFVGDCGNYCEMPTD
jgi:hypothetical protein